MFGLPGKYTFAKTTVKDKPPPSLMQLPIEIRLQIYRYLLVTKNKISNPGALIKCGIRLGNDCAAWRIYPNLTMKILRISRQVYNEALPIFYQENTFSFSCAEDMVHFQFNGLRWGRLSNDLSFFNFWTRMDRLTYIRRLELVISRRGYGNLGHEEYEWRRVFQSGYIWKPDFPGVSDLVLDFGMMAYRTGSFDVNPIIEKFCKPGGLQRLKTIGVTKKSHLDELRRRLLSKDGLFEAFDAPMF